MSSTAVSSDTEINPENRTFPALMPTYARVGLSFTHGEGVYLYGDDGQRYLDFAAGIAVDALGHCHPHMVDALTRQAKRLWHISNLYEIPDQQRFAERLVAACFADTVFFTNSGVEAWECGVKIIRRHFHAKGQPNRFRIITFDGAFHGRTLGAISATRNEKLIKGFGPLLDGFDVVAFGNMNEVRAAITDDTAAIHIEPVQGEGGIRAVDARLLSELRAVCDEYGLLLYLDEIQCGMGRTGKLFAHQWTDVKPDVMCLAKGIGGGFPLGACLATKDAAAAMTAGSHGTTYGGNPLAMAVGNAVLDVLQGDGFLEHVALIGETLGAMLEELAGAFPFISEVRGQGLMRGLKLEASVPNADFINALREEGMLAVPAADNVVRLLPPLIIEESHVLEAKTALIAAASACAQSAGEAGGA